MTSAVSPLSTFLIGVFGVSAGIVPAHYIMNRFLREEPTDWHTGRGIAVMAVAAGLIATTITVNGMSEVQYNFAGVVVAFVLVFVASLVMMLLVGVLFVYPLHWFQNWMEPADVIQQYRP